MYWLLDVDERKPVSIIIACRIIFRTRK